MHRRRWYLNATHPSTMSRTQIPPTALTPAVQRRPLAGARRPIPRRIHGARLAIASTARSDRRIAVRRPGVGIDASSASADPARAPWRSTASSCQVPGTPRSSTLPRSSNPVPEPTTRSRTVRDTRMSPPPHHVRRSDTGHPLRRGPARGRRNIGHPDPRRHPHRRVRTAGCGHRGDRGTHRGADLRPGRRRCGLRARGTLICPVMSRGMNLSATAARGQPNPLTRADTG